MFLLHSFTEQLYLIINYGYLDLLLLLVKQATIADRGVAFRQQCELLETIKFKEIDL